MDVLGKSEARRIAWALVIANLRMRAHGTECISQADIETLAAPLTGPAQWGLLAGCLADIAAQGWTELHDDNPAAAYAEAMSKALDLTDPDDE